MPSFWSSDVCSRSEEHTSELQSHDNLVCRLLLEKQYQQGENVPALRHPGDDAQSALILGEFVDIMPFPPDRARGDRMRALVFFFKGTAAHEVSPLSPAGGPPV